MEYIVCASVSVNKGCNVEHHLAICNRSTATLHRDTNRKAKQAKNSPKIQQSLSSKPSMAKAAAEASFVVVCNQVKHKKPFTDGGYGKKNGNNCGG